jgi:hypothetical protein
MMVRLKTEFIVFTDAINTSKFIHERLSEKISMCGKRKETQNVYVGCNEGTNLYIQVEQSFIYCKTRDFANLGCVR